MRKSFGALIFAFVLVGALAGPVFADKPGSFDSNGNVTSTVTDTGFNVYGYNYTARIFSGLADGVDNSLDGTVWGDPTYANDRLVMKWNAAWDACNANGYDDATYCAGAWDINEWNGMVPGGSGVTEHDMIIWVGSAGEASPYWAPGGTLIWGNYEWIFSQGIDASGHYWTLHASPTGLGI